MDPSGEARGFPGRREGCGEWGGNQEAILRGEGIRSAECGVRKLEGGMGGRPDVEPGVALRAMPGQGRNVHFSSGGRGGGGGLTFWIWGLELIWKLDRGNSTRQADEPGEISNPQAPNKFQIQTRRTKSRGLRLLCCVEGGIRRRPLDYAGTGGMGALLVGGGNWEGEVQGRRAVSRTLTGRGDDGGGDPGRREGLGCPGLWCLGPSGRGDRLGGSVFAALRRDRWETAGTGRP